MNPSGRVILWEDHKGFDNLKERGMPQMNLNNNLKNERKEELQVVGSKCQNRKVKTKMYNLNSDTNEQFWVMGSKCLDM